MLKKIIFNMLLYTSLLCPTLVYALNFYPSNNSACPTNPIRVPFTNFSLNKKCLIFADYAFGSTNKVLFCYPNAATTDGVLYWHYLGDTFVGAMPIQLTVSSKYQGYLADSTGTLQIINNTTSTITVNCLFAF